MEKRKVRYGVISTASVAPRFVAAAKDTDNSEFIAIASRSLGKAEEFAKANGIPRAYGSYEELLEDGDIDAVYIPLVNSLHFPYAMAALEAGKHVIVEKPFTVTASQAIELFEKAEERGLFICEAIKVLFLPVIREVKEIVDSEIYGKLHFIQLSQSYVGNNYASGWNKKREFGGGVLLGNEAYYMSVCEYLAGKISSYAGMSTSSTGEVEDQASVSLVTQNNVLAVSNVSTDILFENGMMLYMEKGRIWVPDYWKARKAYVYAGEELVRTISYPVEHEMCYELQHYSDCILNGRKTSDVATPDMTVRYIRICEDLLNKWNEVSPER